MKFRIAAGWDSRPTLGRSAGSADRGGPWSSAHLCRSSPVSLFLPWTSARTISLDHPGPLLSIGFPLTGLAASRPRVGPGSVPEPVVTGWHRLASRSFLLALVPLFPRRSQRYRRESCSRRRSAVEGGLRPLRFVGQGGGVDGAGVQLSVGIGTRACSGNPASFPILEAECDLGCHRVHEYRRAVGVPDAVLSPHGGGVGRYP